MKKIVMAKRDKRGCWEICCADNLAFEVGETLKAHEVVCKLETQKGLHGTLYSAFISPRAEQADLDVLEAELLAIGQEGDDG